MQSVRYGLYVFSVQTNCVGFVISILQKWRQIGAAKVQSVWVYVSVQKKCMGFSISILKKCQQSAFNHDHTKMFE